MSRIKVKTTMLEDTSRISTRTTKVMPTRTTKAMVTKLAIRTMATITTEQTSDKNDHYDGNTYPSIYVCSIVLC